MTPASLTSLAVPSASMTTDTLPIRRRSPRRPTADLVVSGIGVATPWGSHPAVATARRPAAEGGWFDYRTELGPRGYKYLPPACQFLLAATRRALADAGDSLEEVAEHDRGAAVGTNSAASALHAGMDRTVIETSADDLSPVFAPYFSINLFGSRLAVEYALKGFNLTLTSPRVAALEAVQAGARSLAFGRASWLIAGATEAPLDVAEPGVGASEEGAVALVLEQESLLRSRGGRSYGRCRVHSAFLPPAVAGSAAGAATASEAIGDAFAALGVEEWERLPLRVVLDDSAVGAAFGRVVGRNAVRVDPGAGCLEPLLQVAGALATADEECAVVTAAAEGNLAVALVTPDSSAGSSGRRLVAD